MLAIYANFIGMGKANLQVLSRKRRRSDAGGESRHFALPQGCDPCIERPRVNVVPCRCSDE
jgi:hypothetical protein